MKDPAQVLTTLRSLSRQANKINPKIPVIGPKLAKKSAPVAPTKPAEIPAWSTHQYGFINSSSENTGVHGRRDIVPKLRKEPVSAPKIMIKSRVTGKPVPPVPGKKPGFNVFGDSTDEGKNEQKIEIKNKSLINPNLSASVESDNELDPSIYEFDEVFDKIQAAKKLKKSATIGSDQKVSIKYKIVLKFVYLLFYSPNISTNYWILKK